MYSVILGDGNVSQFVIRSDDTALWYMGEYNNMEYIENPYTAYTYLFIFYIVWNHKAVYFPFPKR